jgi:hypothetical protein
MTFQNGNVEPLQDINVEEELQKVHKDMEDAEDELEATGFSVVQWMLIKRYILAAISHLNNAQGHLGSPENPGLKQ